MGLAENLLNATNRFYEAAAGRDDLQAALTEMADLMEADCAVMEVYDRATGAPLFMENARVDLGHMSAYAAEYAGISPRIRYGQSPGAADIQHDALILGEREMDLDPYYAEFLAPAGLRYFLAISLDPDPARFGILSFQYRPTQGAVDIPKLRLAAALRPHLARAMDGMWRRRNLADPNWILADIRARFGLTEAEALLACSIAKGVKLQDHAERRGIAMSTLHTHYERLKHKAGCRRQADLVALLQRLYPTH